MCFIKRITNKIDFLRMKKREKKMLTFLIPTVLICVFLIYYFPIYGIIWISDDKLLAMGDKIYAVISPFTLAPIIVEIFLLGIFIFYTNLILRIIFGIMYIVSFFFSLVALMGYRSISDLRFWAIQIVIIIPVIAVKVMEKSC